MYLYLSAATFVIVVCWQHALGLPCERGRERERVLNADDKATTEKKKKKTIQKGLVFEKGR